MNYRQPGHEGGGDKISGMEFVGAITAPHGVEYWEA